MLFYETALQYLNKEKCDLSPYSVRSYYWNLKKISDFMPYLDLAELNEETVLGYKRHMQMLGNGPVTINKGLSVFRIFVNKMAADGLVKNNPFDKIKVGRIYTRRGFLTMRELKNLYLNFEYHRNMLTKTECDTMRVFLFSCFTGLRYNDLRSLDANEIFDWKIRKQMHKNCNGKQLFAALIMHCPCNEHRHCHVKRQIGDIAGQNRRCGQEPLL